LRSEKLLKTSKTGLLVLGIVVLVAAIVVAGFLYQKENGKRDKLTLDLAAAKATAQRLDSSKKSAQANIASLADSQSSAKAALDQSLAVAFPFALDSTSYGQTLFNYAAPNNLQIVNFTTTAPQQAKVPGAETEPYQSVGLDLQMTGTMADAMSFVHGLNNDEHFRAVTLGILDASLQDPNAVDMFQVPTQFHVSMTAYGYRSQ
jgi:cytoskeletal protein RodZ